METQLNPTYFAWGYNKEKQLGFRSNLQNQETPYSFSLPNNEYISQIAATIYSTIIICSNGDIFLSGKIAYEQAHYNIENKFGIDKISAGCSQILTKTEDNKAYEFRNDYNIISQTKTINPEPVHEFKDKIVIDIACDASKMFIVTDPDGQLWHSNSAYYNDNSDTKTGRFDLIATNVQRIFSGNDSHHFFVITRDNRLLVSGTNVYGQLGIGSIENIENLTEIKTFKEVDKIIDIQTGYYQSLLLYSQDSFGRLYSCGSHRHNGLQKTQDQPIFQLIPKFIDMNIVSIACGSAHSLAINDLNEVFVWGENTNYGELGFGNSNSALIPQKLILPDFVSDQQLFPFCGPLNSFVFFKSDASLENDFRILLERQEFFTEKIDFLDGYYPVHSNILTARLNSEKIPLFKQIMNTIQLHLGKKVLQWIYYGKLFPEILPILAQLGFDIEKIKKYSTSLFREDLHKLYLDDDSKDFTIISQNKPIKAHKFVLAARSDLFRGMFLNVNDSSNKVNEYSNRRFETINIFIKYLYLAKFEKSDFNKKILDEILEEMIDIEEYFQLNSCKHFQNELKKIQKIFNKK
ncbi:btk-binding protein-related [Anaeramoeba ignava]|uniref:Btk-binding protein-related n=1 Tax=Anaeramoeba ignava TaxID=1746090 RepID=A0A9Q0L643_ANAIG|nr:btk-binding protein-related [Anaeramoeba ignava]